MKLNRKLEIGLTVVNALKTKTGFTKTSDLTTEVGTTLHLLEQVMRNLRAAGILNVKRGPGGGYALAAGKVTAHHVATAVGRDLGELRFDESPTSRLSKAIIEAYVNTAI
jgi:DNA-binding IscR family transcriptional regulator